jgi:endonuclease G
MKKTGSWLLAVAALTAGALSIVAQQNVETDNTEVAWHCRDDEHLVELFTVGGRPINNDRGYRVKVLINSGYVVGYCEERRNPLWAAYRASGLAGKGEPERFERSDFFSRDIRVIPAVDGRTFGGGFDRGHMVPNAAIASQYGSLAQMETFFMTNMCPQKDDLNRHAWANLERWIPQAAEKFRHVYVLCGPMFGNDPPTVENGKERGVQIPDAFYMILMDTDLEFQAKPKVRLLAYSFPQTTDKDADFTDRKRFGISINAIEDAVKLDFFPEFAKLFADWEDREGVVEEKHWTLD